MTDGSTERPVGTVQNDYVWNGTAWVPQRDSTGNTFDGRSWGRPPLPPLPPPAPSGSPFVDPHYAYAFTRQTSDDLQFIARYIKIVIIVHLVLVGLSLVTSLLFMGTIAALVEALLGSLLR